VENGKWKMGSAQNLNLNLDLDLVAMEFTAGHSGDGGTG
jgi:hypothetical protein